MKGIRRALALSLAGAVVTLVAVVGAVAAPSAPVVVASGLDNPRQLSLRPNGDLLVAINGPSQAGPPAPVGRIGLIRNAATAVDAPVETAVGGLLSVGEVGPNGVSGLGGGVFWTVNSITGQLSRVNPAGKVTDVVDMAAYEAENNPGGGEEINPNPYAVLAHSSGAVLAADAGGNYVLKYEDGVASTFHVFDDIESDLCGDVDFVPTSLAEDRWGNVYVGALAGECPGAGTVVKLSPTGTELSRCSGFMTVHGLAVDRDGNMYVSQLFASLLTKVAPDCEVLDEAEVPFPAGVAVDRHGNVFVSAFSVDFVGPGLGAVWRIRFS